MTKQNEISYINSETGDSLSFGASGFTQPLTESKGENVLILYASCFEDVAVFSFEKGININGKEALVSKVTAMIPMAHRCNAG